MLTIRLDDLFLGIGGLILVETYIVGTVIIGWVRDLDDAAQRGDFVFIIENAPRLIRYWYSTSATYIFSVVCTILETMLIHSGSLNLGSRGFCVDSQTI